MVERVYQVLVAIGGAVGVPLALVAARAVAGLLYDTPPSDPISYGTAVGTLVLVAAAAAYMPARRASRLDPMVALRSE